MPDDSTPDAPTPRRPLLRGVVLGVVLVGVARLVYVLGGSNFHTVIPGAIYRSAQPSAERLEDVIRNYHIRTVVNFRGVCDPSPWYLDECRVSARNGVSQEDLNGCSAGRLPSVHTIHELVRILDQSEYPILFHCNRGIDRTGLASAVALLFHTDSTVATARHQLGLQFAHLPWGRTGNMERFFDLYEEWLRANHQTHSRTVFRQWLLEGYCPGPCRAAITLIEGASEPLHVAAGKSGAVRARFTNTSVQTWQFQPGSNAGIHAVYSVEDAEGREVGGGKAGLFEAAVAPGASIDLTLALPPLARGRYVLRVDMTDEQHAGFFQVGSEPLEVALEVP